MKVVNGLLENIELPRMVKIRQKLPDNRLDKIDEEIINQIRIKNIKDGIKEGDKIAITVGSRGIANQPLMIKTIVDEIKDEGGKPFIIPAMGSHGGATSEGQKEVLENMGFTEESLGAPIRSTMEVVKIGETETGLPVCIDKYAHEADGIVIVNRVKLHTSFSGKFESGLMKMIAIGLGKQKGADICHGLGFGTMSKNVLDIAKVVIDKANIVLGLAILENAYDETAKVEILKKEDFEPCEPDLLEESKLYMPKISIDKIDVLIIDEIGKNISGTGMDPNVTGRYHTPYGSGGPEVTKMVVLDLSEKTHGNGNGIGISDFTTKRVFDKFDYEQTYLNSLTSTIQDSIKMPMVLESDKLALAAAVKTCNIFDRSKVRVVRIINTKYLDTICISENLVEEICNDENIEILGKAEEFKFDENGNLTDLAAL